MIGTLICRNCDTVFEVSEGDVTKFKVHPVFPCTVCQADLSPLMAGFVEGHSAEPLDPANEFTIPDDQEVFDGLPMGETFDQAAAKIRGVGPAAAAPVAPAIAQARPNNSEFADTVRNVQPPLAGRARPEPERTLTPEPTPVLRQPEPTPVIAEDPVQMALRLAAQAAQQAAAMASRPPANGIAEGDVTGVAIRRKPPMQAPIAKAGNGSAVASTEVGVVPEEPENEPTARGRGPETSEITEPTMPSPEGSRDEPTPLLGASQFTGAEMDSVPETADDEAIPDVAEELPRRSEPTPAMRPLPPQLSEAPMEEPTVRKSSPPPPIPMLRPLAARSGVGPGAVGALGIRVVVGRPIVRPNSSGRAMTPPADTAVSGSHPIPRFEPARTPASGTRAPAPAPVSDVVAPPTARAAKPAVPAMLLAVVGTLTVGLVVVVAWALAHRGHVAPAETPTPTPVAEATSEAAPTATENEIAPVTPVPRHSGLGSTTTPAPLPSRTAVALATATPVKTPASAVTATPAPTPAVSVAPTPRATQVTTPKLATPAAAATPNPETLAAMTEAKKKAALRDYDKAIALLIGAHNHDANNEELHYQIFSYMAMSADPRAYEFASYYRDHFSNDRAAPATHRALVLDYLAKHPKP